MLALMAASLFCAALSYAYTDSQKHPYGPDWRQFGDGVAVGASENEEGEMVFDIWAYAAYHGQCSWDCNAFTSPAIHQPVVEEKGVSTESYCIFKGTFDKFRCDDEGEAQVNGEMVGQDTGCCCDDCTGTCGSTFVDDPDDPSCKNMVPPSNSNVDSTCVSDEDNIIEGDITEFLRLGGETIIKITSIDRCNGEAYCEAAFGIYSTDDGDIRQECCDELTKNWTGTVCCQEGFDKYYKNDNNYGCWDGRLLRSGEYPRDTANDTVYYKAEFYGCKIGAQNYIQNNEWIQNLTEYYTAETLVVDKDYCSLIADNQMYCSFTEEWKPAPIEFQNKGIRLSTVPWNSTLQKAECCQVDMCYNGSTCVNSQDGSPTGKPNSEGYRCVNGTWDKAVARFTPETPQSMPTMGYCPRTDQCLWNIRGNSADNDNPSGNPQCITTGQYIDDYYCENNGIWSTRTKWVAAALNGLKGADYTIYCGRPETVLAYMDYIVGTKSARNIIQGTSNNYCVLISDGKTIVGTTLNGNLTREFMGIFSYSSCNLNNDNQFHSCGSNSNLWYNSGLGAALYSNAAFQVPNMDLPQNINSMDAYFDGLIKKINLSLRPIYDDSFLDEGIVKYSELFFNKKGSKMVFGAMEGMQYKDLALEFIDFGTDICDYVNDYGIDHSDISSGVKCLKSGRTHYIISQGTRFTNMNPEDLWPELTAKVKFS